MLREEEIAVELLSCCADGWELFAGGNHDMVVTNTGTNTKHDFDFDPDFDLDSPWRYLLGSPYTGAGAEEAGVFRSGH